MQAHQLQEWQKELDKLAQDAREKGYTVATPKLSVDNIHGNKLAYYRHNNNSIVFHEDYMLNGSDVEVYDTLIYELAHAVAEQNNTTNKRIWHGDTWKKINKELGGDAERYHKEGYTKPEPKKTSMKDLYATLPKLPKDTWDRGTYKQWLSRGYHAIKGEKGQFTTWEFIAEEYETAEDGNLS